MRGFVVFLTTTTTTPHYTPIHSTTLHSITFSDTQLHYATLRYTTLHSTTLHYATLHSTTLHYTTLRCIPLHYTTLHYTPLHDTTLHLVLKVPFGDCSVGTAGGEGCVAWAVAFAWPPGASRVHFPPGLSGCWSVGRACSFFLPVVFSRRLPGCGGCRFVRKFQFVSFSEVWRGASNFIWRSFFFTGQLISASFHLVICHVVSASVGACFPFSLAVKHKRETLSGIRDWRSLLA